MELEPSIEAFFSPLAPYLEPKDNEYLEECQTEFEERDKKNSSESHWSTCSLNPCNLLDNLNSTPTLWRIDGSSGMGRELYAIPIFMLPNIPLKRIDLVIPGIAQQPKALRNVLDSSLLYNSFNPDVNKLKISRYLVEALSSWSSSLPYFREIYTALPFGSKMFIKQLESKPEAIRIRFMPNTALERQLKTRLDLARFCNMEEDSLPPNVHVESLRHISQVNNNISIIRSPFRESNVIFKTNMRNMANMYHELKLLISMKPHRHIVPRPLRIVTIGKPVDSSSLVIGFILPLLTGGSLQEVLDDDIRLSYGIKLDWARQLLQVMRDVCGGPALFYSDLKPDNVLVSSDRKNITLIDFEQAGNWDTFRAPEIVYLSWMEKLCQAQVVPEETRKAYQRLVQSPTIGLQDEWQSMWTHLSPYQREQAIVFSMGKLFWCMFEHASHTGNSVGERYEKAVTVEFPNFVSTPDSMRKLIRSCTIDAPEWSSVESESIVREGNRVLTKSTGAFSPNYSASPVEIVEASRRLWRHRLASIDNLANIELLEGQSSYQAVVNEVATMRRPSLAELAAELERLSKSPDPSELLLF